MAINPVNLSRVSHNMRAAFATSSLQRNQRELFAGESQIASGRRFVTPSDDPVAAARTLDLTQARQRQEQFLTNIRHGDALLNAADEAVLEINNLLIEAQAIASKNVSNLTSAAERRADAELIAGIRQQLQSVGNRLFDGRYIFAGRDTASRPFVEALGGVAYVGDVGELSTRVDDDAGAVVNVPGNVLFAALSSQVRADVDLTPSLRETLRLDDLRGPDGRGVVTGTLVISESGAAAFTVDLSSADTIGDVVALINEAAAAAGSSLVASLSDVGIDLAPGTSEITVTDTAGVAVAASLGIAAAAPTTDVVIGRDLGPRLTRLTPVEDLDRGAGIDLTSGLIITNGTETVTLDLSSARTVQDVINTINSSGVYVSARINDDATGIDVFNQVSGVSLTIGENGGTTATDLGIRTYSADTLLADLNSGRGATLASGKDDLRVTAKDGSSFDVNLDGSVTVGDVVDVINSAAVDAGVSITASLADVGNGIVLTDATGGTGSLSVTALNQSAAADDLGLLQSIADPATELLGQDRNPARAAGIFSVLIELESALLRDDDLEIAAAAARLDPVSQDVTRNHGIIGAKARAIREKMEQMEGAASAAEVFLSEVRDLDFAEAVTRLQQSLAQLQANMQVSSQVLNLSLLDFLG